MNYFNSPFSFIKEVSGTKKALLYRQGFIRKYLFAIIP